MTFEEYNKRQERVREHNPLWMTGRRYKVPLGKEINEIKKLSIRQYSRGSLKVKKPNPPPPQRGWWYR